MQPQPKAVWTNYLGLALVSASILALQVVFTRIFSIMIWHHFTYLVVGVAMLGGGAAGVFLAVSMWDLGLIRQRLGTLSLAFSLCILITLAIIVTVKVDPLRMDQFSGTAIGLGLYFAGLFATFFLGSLLIAGMFSVWTSQAHRLYFADLLGASLSTLVVLWVIHQIGGPRAIILIAMMAAVAGLLLSIRRQSRLWIAGLLLVQCGVFAVISIYPLQVPIPESKPLHWALNLVGSDSPEFTRWNPVARVDVTASVEVSEPMIVGGVSKKYLRSQAQLQDYLLHLVTLDGTSMTGLYEFDGDISKFEFLRHALISAPFIISEAEPSTLMIGSGGGIDILLARLFDARSITAIDINSDVNELLTDHYAEMTGNLADAETTEIITAEGRSFLMRSQEQFDVIQGIGLDNIAALSTGAYVLSESYLYTVEAFELALDRLGPTGILSWTRAASDPPIETLRLVGIAAEALRRQGVATPAAHIFVVANDTNSAINLLVSKSAINDAQIAKLVDWADATGFMILQRPDMVLDNVYAAYLSTADPRAFEAAYPYNIYPVVDDHPFYYNYFKWNRLLEGGATTGNLSSRLPVGNVILLVMLTFSIVAAIAFIVIPLWRNQRAGLQTPYSGQMLIYFGALGLAYMFMQIVLIQRFTLFIGYPTYAITTTIFSMLMFSALGSLSSQYLLRAQERLRSILLIVVVLTILYAVGLSQVFHLLHGLSDVGRIIASVFLIAPLAFFMGIPFPTGLRQLGINAPALVAWAWGINGIFSVLGSTLVIIVGMWSSFTVALLVTAASYFIAGVVVPALSKIRIEARHEYKLVAQPNQTMGK